MPSLHLFTFLMFFKSCLGFTIGSDKKKAPNFDIKGDKNLSTLSSSYENLFNFGKHISMSGRGKGGKGLGHPSSGSPRWCEAYLWPHL